MPIRTISSKLFSDAKQHLAGGVNSPVRAYRGLDMPPPFIERASGAYLWDVDGNKYIDLVGSWGPMILGHAHPKVVEAICRAAEMGTSFGAPTAKETELAVLVKDAFPSIDLLRLVSSGTEAVMSAIRVARGFTARSKIIKFNGCYHGHADHLLVKAGSGAATFSEPDSAGVPKEFAEHTLVAEYNDLENVRTLVSANNNNIAAIIVEPIAGNMGLVLPKLGFLAGLRKICYENKIVLIFDEVITGFRVTYGGAQKYYDVKPDMTCLGKILGGGMPLGAYGGRKEIMECVSPLGPVYQAGTLSGNPVAVSAGIATIKILRDEVDYMRLEKTTKDLTSGISNVLKEKGIRHKINSIASLFTVFYGVDSVTDFPSAARSDRAIFNETFMRLIRSGIYTAPSPFECAFVSTAHSPQDIEQIIISYR